MLKSASPRFRSTDCFAHRAEPLAQYRPRSKRAKIASPRAGQPRDDEAAPPEAHELKPQSSRNNPTR
jgi:hypothetical protein